MIGSKQQQVSFAIISHLNYPALLGIQWLKVANPSIDWQTRHIQFPSGILVQHLTPPSQKGKSGLCFAEAYVQLAHAPGVIIFAVHISPQVSKEKPVLDHPTYILKLACVKQLGISSLSLYSMSATTTGTSHW